MVLLSTDVSGSVLVSRTGKDAVASLTPSIGTVTMATSFLLTTVERAHLSPQTSMLGIKGFYFLVSLLGI